MGWKELVPGAWLYEYPVKQAGITSNSLAVRTADGGVAVVSPPSTASEADFAATEALGPVRALIANNVGHDLGQQPWQARYPDAVSYAPSEAIGGIEKAKKGLRPIRPLADLAPLLPAGTRVWEAPGTRSGATFVTVQAPEGSVFFTDELIGNAEKVSSNPVFGFVFRITGSAPGYRISNLYKWIFCKDARALATAMLDEAEASPPSWQVCAHGPPVRDPLPRMRSLLAPIAGR